ncbi:FAD-dependent oxidoreductase [Nonomuraea aurantiaca]|uniref:FAD-dependent oxidoreductase n=1 Tax=Nonomuraea aurantiaca TaxID=2878562 RepID=UPI001CD94451|nr:NAD(P)/FAD-dependent oxidoreductase [Nonomuraea aurantiaca]MCA2229045.1 FAD-dependent monooxygenase [Nonomuraea aurantiaca]
MPTIKVIVIGAGTGGLCLAHGLKQAGIEVAVYERDRTRADGLQGYRVGISPDGSRALHDCLPPELFETFLATCARPPRYSNILTERLTEVLSLGDGRPPGDDPVDSEKSVSRMTLRQVLLTGLEDVVHFDKVFRGYERNADGTVTAFFEDGTQATGDLLVGADGTNSRVRRQYLPHAVLEDSGLVGITGKIALTAETRELVTPKMLHGVSMVFAPKGYLCVYHVMEFPWDEQGRPREGIGATDARLISGWPGLTFDNTRDYIMWGWAAAARRLPADVLDLKGPDLQRLVLERTAGWHPHLRRLFELADPGSCFPINIRTSVPPGPWPAGNVTLIGDAIHTMTPGRGVGANTALRDARLLARNLAAVRDGESTLLEAVGGYEDRMREYGFDAVRESRKQMSADGAVHRPIIGRLALAGMRTAMRTINHLPPVKRKMEQSQAAYRGEGRGD